MEDGAMVEDIAVLIIGGFIGLAPWLLDKVGIEMPRPVYVGVLSLSIVVVSWALLKLGWVERIPGLKNRSISLSSSFIFLLALVAITCILFRTTGLFFSEFKPYTDIPLNSLDQVIKKSFENETVEAEGKNFEHCTFRNVTLVYRGRKTSSFRYNTFLGTLHIITDNPPMGGFGETLRAFGMFQQDGSVKSWTDERGFHIVRTLAGAPGK